MLFKWSLDVLGLALFGFDFEGLTGKTDNPWALVYKQFDRDVKKPHFVLFPALDQQYRWLFPTRQAAHDNLDQFHHLLRGVIKERRLLLEEQQQQKQGEKDLLTLMIESGQNGVDLSDEELLNNLCVFFAGKEVWQSWIWLIPLLSFYKWSWSWHNGQCTLVCPILPSKGPRYTTKGTTRSHPDTLWWRRRRTEDGYSSDNRANQGNAVHSSNHQGDAAVQWNGGLSRHSQGGGERSYSSHGSSSAQRHAGYRQHLWPSSQPECMEISRGVWPQSIRPWRRSWAPSKWTHIVVRKRRRKGGLQDMTRFAHSRCLTRSMLSYHRMPFGLGTRK